MFKALGNFLSQAGSSIKSSAPSGAAPDMAGAEVTDKKGNSPLALLSLAGKSNPAGGKKSDKPQMVQVQSEDAGKNLANLFSMQNNEQG